MGGFSQKFQTQKKSRFIVDTTPPKPPPNQRGVLCFNVFSCFSSLLFSALVLLFSLCFSYILKPESCPPSEVAGIYIYIVGSIIGSLCGVFRVNIWATVGSITGPYHFYPIKIVVSEDFCEPSLQRGVQSFRRFLVFWSKNRLFRKRMVAIPFFNFLFWWLLVDVCTRVYKKGEAKKPYKTSFFFCHSPLERRKRVKRRERPEVKKDTTIFTNGLDVVPHFWAPKFQF